MNILIAEDDSLIQEMTGFLMESWGFDFDMVTNGREAVDHALNNQGKYDLCMMDIDMPVMDGYEAVRHIRSKVKYFPILGVSANPAARETCKALGMDDFLTKPYDLVRLKLKISELTVKSAKLYFKDTRIHITREMPMDQKHAKELKGLKAQGLVKLRLDGPEDHEVIAHKNVPNKISHDFNVKKHMMTEFLNRDAERPTVCDLYRGNKNCIVETFLDEEDYAKRLKQEDEEIENYASKIFKADEE